MKTPTIVAVAMGGLVAACVAFVVGLLLIKLLWAWTVPDLFPGAVKGDLIAREISWLAAVKVALFFAVLAGIGRGIHGETKGKGG